MSLRDMQISHCQQVTWKEITREFIMGHKSRVFRVSWCCTWNESAPWWTSAVITHFPSQSILIRTRSQAWGIQGQTDKILITSPFSLLLVCFNHTSPASHPNQELQPQNLTQCSDSGKVVQGHHFLSLSCWPISKINNKIYKRFSGFVPSLSHIYK